MKPGGIVRAFKWTRAFTSQEVVSFRVICCSVTGYRSDHMHSRIFFPEGASPSESEKLRGPEGLAIGTETKADDKVTQNV